ncbi:MAG: diguanylate cyclase [Gammaproteobacteria bacterium]|nr:diguanylate cyclase [Gammaproteobacteria bacterium]
MTDANALSTSTTLLRQAVPLMAKHAVAVTPHNYAVWYSYVEGNKPGLNAEIDQRIAAGEPFDEAFIARLHADYFEAPEKEALQAAHRSLRAMAETIMSSLTKAGGQVAAYEASLNEHAAEMSADMPADKLHGMVESLISSTRDMQTGTESLSRDLEESKREAETLREELQQARHEALTDPLTGLANRAGFDQFVAELRADDDMAEQRHALLIADIDKFKSVNDNYGHLLGDKVIKLIADTLKNMTKGKDMASRFGGEEFVLLLPATTVDGAETLAEMIRSAVEKARVVKPKTGESVGQITISLGVTDLSLDEDLDAVIERADKALYFAKNNGRNRVELFRPELPSEAVPA